MNEVWELPAIGTSIEIRSELTDGGIPDGALSTFVTLSTFIIGDGTKVFSFLTGAHRAHHGYILHQASKLAEQGQLKPLLAEQQFGPGTLAEAYELVARGSRGKVAIEF